MKHSLILTRMPAPIRTFALDESGAITVDWTVISCAAVSLALGTAALMSDVTGMLSNNMDTELRDGDISDGWPRYTHSHFEPIIDAGGLTVEGAEALHDTAFDMMNHEIINQVNAGIEAMEAGTITEEELAELVSMASIAYHRDLVDEAVLDHYFGFEGSDPFYMTQTPAAQTGAT